MILGYLGGALFLAGCGEGVDTFELGDKAKKTLEELNQQEGAASQSGKKAAEELKKDEGKAIKGTLKKINEGVGSNPVADQGKKAGETASGKASEVVGKAKDKAKEVTGGGKKEAGTPSDAAKPEETKPKKKANPAKEAADASSGSDS